MRKYLPSDEIDLVPTRLLTAWHILPWLWAACSLLA